MPEFPLSDDPEPNELHSYLSAFFAEMDLHHTLAVLKRVEMGFDCPAYGDVYWGRVNRADYDALVARLEDFGATARQKPGIRAAAATVLRDLESSCAEQWLRGRLASPWGDAGGTWTRPDDTVVPAFLEAVRQIPIDSEPSPALSALTLLDVPELGRVRALMGVVKRTPEEWYCEYGGGNGVDAALALPILALAFCGDPAREVPARYYWALHMTDQNFSVSMRWAFYRWLRPEQTTAMLSQVQGYVYDNDTRIPDGAPHWLRRLAKFESQPEGRAVDARETIESGLSHNGRLPSSEAMDKFLTQARDLLGDPRSVPVNPDTPSPLLWVLKATALCVSHNFAAFERDAALYRRWRPWLEPLSECLSALCRLPVERKVRLPYRLYHSGLGNLDVYFDFRRLMLRADLREPDVMRSWLQRLATSPVAAESQREEVRQLADDLIRFGGIQTGEAMEALLAETSSLFSDVTTWAPGPLGKDDPRWRALKVAVCWLVTGHDLLDPGRSLFERWSGQLARIAGALIWIELSDLEPRLDFSQAHIEGWGVQTRGWPPIGAGEILWALLAYLHGEEWRPHLEKLAVDLSALIDRRTLHKASAYAGRLDSQNFQDLKVGQLVLVVLALLHDSVEGLRRRQGAQDKAAEEIPSRVLRELQNRVGRDQ